MEGILREHQSNRNQEVIVMSRIKLITLFTLLIGSNLISFGQQIQGSYLSTPKEYYLQVKQFGEFLNRFNYKTDWKGNLITEEFSKKIPRNAYILSLINQNDPRLTDPLDSSYRVTCSEFLAFIVNAQNPQEINLYSGQVKAQAFVNIICFGSARQVKVEMIPDVLPDRSARWVINGVESSLFAANADSIKQHFIAPNSHETNFINLKKLNDSTNGTYYLSSPVANTITFIKGIEQKKIQIQSIEKVTYQITFTRWLITVDEFTRDSNNSGWLISNVKKL
jgi:hypothetical protein